MRKWRCEETAADGAAVFCAIGNCVPYDTKASGGRRTPRRGIWLLTQPRSGASVRQAHTFLCVEIAFPMPQKPPAEGVFRLEEKGRLEKHVWGRFLKAQVSGRSSGRKEQTGSGRIVTAADLREGDVKTPCTEGDGRRLGNGRRRLFSGAFCNNEKISSDWGQKTV